MIFWKIYFNQFRSYKFRLKFTWKSWFKWKKVAYYKFKRYIKKSKPYVRVDKKIKIFDDNEIE